MIQVFRFKSQTLILAALIITSGAWAQENVSVELPSSSQSQPQLKSTPPTLTLSAAVAIARENNPGLQETKEQIIQSELNIPIARALLFPAINATGTAVHEKSAAYTGSSTPFGGDPYNLYNAGLTAKQPLYQLGSISAIQSADKAYQISKVTSEISERTLVSNVINGYYQLILNVENVQTYLRQQKIEQESLKTAIDRERTGRGQLLDVLQAKTQLALLDAQISNAQNQVQIAAAQLANYLGESQRTELHVKGTLDAPDIKVVDSVVNLKNFRFPELESNFLSQQQLDLQRSVLLGQQLPKLYANGAYSYGNYVASDLFNGASHAWSIGLELDIPLFAGLSYIYQKRQLVSQQTQAQIDRTNIENNLTLLQVTSRKNLEIAQESMVSGEQALKLAIASSNEARKQFRYATIDFVQFLTVEQSYVTAEQTLNQSKYSYIQALSSYFVASGQQLQNLVNLLEGNKL
jgi:outer membrane protein TolC